MQAFPGLPRSQQVTVDSIPEIHLFRSANFHVRRFLRCFQYSVKAYSAQPLRVSVSPYSVKHDFLLQAIMKLWRIWTVETKFPACEGLSGFRRSATRILVREGRFQCNGGRFGKQSSSLRTPCVIKCKNRKFVFDVIYYNIFIIIY